MNDSIKKMAATVVAAALAVGVVLRFVNDDESSMTKTLVSWALMFTIGVAGGLAVFSTIGGAAVAAGLTALAVLTIAVGRGAADDEAKEAYSTARKAASTGRAEAQSTLKRARKAAEKRAEQAEEEASSEPEEPPISVVQPADD